MSTFSLTKGSAAALGMLTIQAGSETLLLTQPARELRAELSIEPFTGDSGDQLLAVLFMREQRHSMTLQRNDGANVQHLADWVEAVANGTHDTAEAIPQRADPSDLAAATAAFHAAAHELNTQAEPAPAQDEREAFEAARRIIVEVRRSCADTDFLVPVIARMLARPAQTEQQPLIYINPMVIDELEGKRKASPGGLTWSRKAWAHWTFPLYAAPIAQTALNSDCEWCAGVGKDHFGEKCEHCQTAPQPEQSGLIKALADAAQSLETISNGAGKDEFMQDMADVRGYARSRAGIARAALATSTTA